MEVTHYIEEVEKYINSFKLQIEDEKKEIAECQKKFSNMQNAFSEKAPSSSVINSLFKDEEPDGFVFSKYEDKRKQLAEQRRAEYNVYLEKKEAELLSKRKNSKEKRNVSAKSILDSVDYERVLAKRKEEEAKFRNMNVADVPHSSKPILKENVRKPDLESFKSPVPTVTRANSINLPTVNLPGAVMGLEEHVRLPLVEEKQSFEALEKEKARLLEERITKHLEEQRRHMLLEFENELRKNNIIKEELQNLKSSNSVRSSPKRIDTRIEEYPKFGRTGGGGEPLRDPYGNLITMRGLKNDSESDVNSIMSFPSMQQQPIKDRMALYREELQRQIEEKKRLEALEKAKARELEEKVAQRIEEQRLQMQHEYENELKKNNKIKEDFQRQQERIRKLEEFQRRDAEERRKKFAAVRAPEPLPQTEMLIERSQSPPIPAVRTKVLLEKVVPPVTTTKALTEVKPENMFSSLAEIRRKIMEEQQKPNKDLQKSYEVMNRRTVQEVSDDDDDEDILKSSYQYSD